MAQTKAWNWGKGDAAIWHIPSEESHYLADRWKLLGYRTVLDLGCGLGRHSVFFARHGFCVSALDLSMEGVQSTLEWAEREGLSIKAAQGNMLSLPYPDDSFDCLFAYHVIYHTDTEGMSRILGEIRRVVRPGGEIYLTLHSKEAKSFRDTTDPRIDENTVLKLEDGPEKDVPHFYTDLDQALAMFDGFEVIKVRHVDDCYYDGQKRDRKHFYLLARRL